MVGDWQRGGSPPGGIEPAAAGAIEPARSPHRRPTGRRLGPEGQALPGTGLSPNHRRSMP